MTLFASMLFPAVPTAIVDNHVRYSLPLGFAVRIVRRPGKLVAGMFNRIAPRSARGRDMAVQSPLMLRRLAGSLTDRLQHRPGHEA